ncbi:efflux RND transporter periplasmic adaptor subunit [Motiliproteus coralliicola]|nr:efflux RND transporter periplasmic adaptor subunit [Motiliproteus coralliicola]
MRGLLWGLGLLSLAVGSAQAQVPVTSKPLSQLLFHPEQSAPARVESLNSSRLSAQLSARIDRILVRVGDRVEPGQLLLELDCRDWVSQHQALQAISRQFQSQIKLAGAQLKRSQNLRSRNSISEEKVEQHETDLNVLRARYASHRQQLEQATLQVERCQIRAPYAGLVRQRLVGLGELADPGTPLLALQQLDALEVVAQLRPQQLNALPDKFEFEFQQRRLPVRLRTALPVIDATARTRELRLEFDIEQALPGSSGRLLWRSTLGRLPADLLIRRQQQLGIMVLNSQTQPPQAQFVALPDAIEGQPAPLPLDSLGELGLRSDTPVIIDGRQALFSGDSVMESP